MGPSPTPRRPGSPTWPRWRRSPGTMCRPAPASDSGASRQRSASASRRLTAWSRIRQRTHYPTLGGRCWTRCVVNWRPGSLLPPPVGTGRTSPECSHGCSPSPTAPWNGVASSALCRASAGFALCHRPLHHPVTERFHASSESGRLPLGVGGYKAEFAVSDELPIG